MPYDTRTLPSVMTSETELMNFSAAKRHAADTDQKLPQRLSRAKRELPSMR